MSRSHIPSQCASQTIIRTPRPPPNIRPAACTLNRSRTPQFDRLILLIDRNERRHQPSTRLPGSVIDYSYRSSATISHRILRASAPLRQSIGFTKAPVVEQTSPNNVHEGSVSSISVRHFATAPFTHLRVSQPPAHSRLSKSVAPIDRSERAVASNFTGHSRARCASGVFLSFATSAFKQALTPEVIARG